MSKKLNWFDNVEARAHPWPGLNWLTTGLCVPDTAKAIDFYTNAMDMVAIAELADDVGNMLFARMRYRGVNFTLNQEGWDSDYLSPLSGGRPSPFIFYLYVDDVGKYVDAMVSAGAVVLVPAQAMF